MARIEINVKMTGIYKYEAPSYAGYGYDTHYIYTMQGEDGTTYVWKTTTFMMIDLPYTGKKGMHNFEDRKGNPVEREKINKGDELRIKATVKGESEYNGEPQIEVNRVSLIERTFRAKTREELEEERKAEREAQIEAQAATITENDLVWRMPYKQYKEHYADCETIIDSYRAERGHKTIAVIIREGRLKASGVRGETFRGYEISYEEDGKTWKAVYRAVSEENAMKRFRKEHKGIEGECTHIYEYGCHRWF